MAPHTLRVIPDYHLTRREQAVAELLAEGMPNKDIAAELSIEKTSVAAHITQILRKSGCTSRLEFALRVRGILDPAT